MARPEQCSNCTKKTTIHFTQIINNKVYKLDMCEDCPLKKDVIDPGNFSLTDIFKPEEANMEEVPTQDVSCEACGFTHSEFEKRGRLGCPECYTWFEQPIRNVIKDMHYGMEHSGKLPSLAVERVSLNQKMVDLKKDLEKVIAEEDFEQAAELRDQIVELESKLSGLTEVG